MSSVLEDLQSRLPAVSPEAWEKLAQWAELVREWNARVNLVSRKDIDQLERHHLAPCLAITTDLKLMNGARVIDVGTGGGLPGIPMAICYPQAHFTLVDSVGKKIRVVEDIAARLDLKNVEVRNCRVETIKRKFDFVTGRAVTNLAAFINWVRPLTHKGRTHSLPNGLLYWRGGDIDAEAATLRSTLSRKVSLEERLADAYFESKYILHFRAEDLRGEPKQEQ